MRGEHELVIPGEQRRDWCSTDACENRLCRKKFSLLVSKQHCQWCGRIFCDNCAPCTATYGGRRLRRCNSCKFPAVFRSLRNLRTGKRDGSVARLIMSFLDSRSINALMHSCYTSLSEFNVGDYVYYESITDRFPTFFEGAMIGKGGFGSVYKCEDRSYPCRRRVALKVITKASVVTYRSWKKIVTELEIMQDVDHHNVAKLLEVLQTPHHLVIVMEAGDGGSLMQAWRLAKEYKYDVEVLVANVVLQVAEGLDYLYHKKGIVHRDIKLENIVLSHDFKRVMIIDFGLAEYVKQCETQLFVPCGTAGYTSPENIRAVVERRRVYEALGETMHLADMYSLGVVAYVLLCGHMPVATRCFSSLYQNMLKGIRCVGPHWANVSDDAKSLVESLVKTNSFERATVAVIREHPFIQAKAPLIVEIVQRHMHKQTETERREVKEWVYVEPLSDHWDMIEVETVSDEENRGLALRKGSSTFGRVGFMNRLKSVVWD
ncbi:protein kinase, putative [Trypanosoma equiperdum]|uniref:Protein kinase, putative n=2 Tax=Trypanozoon TaxID=39700 RepID=Q38FZ0_TRYB2|nr:protein kinase, putative [Trypanosoma brucei brucei TREU927]EAN76280.1 protein kinase, putative [Trypanosoma brucei brucei TREU927]SCU68480.1 protein kinase, putative [Trypanosoma equiperdum]